MWWSYDVDDDDDDDDVDVDGGDDHGDNGVVGGGVVVEYYCFLRIISVGPPNLPDPVCFWNEHIFLNLIQIWHSFDVPANPALLLPASFFRFKICSLRGYNWFSRKNPT